MNPKNTEIEYHGAKTTIGELTIEQAQDMIFELLNEREAASDVVQKMFFYGKMHSIQEEDIEKD